MTTDDRLALVAHLLSSDTAHDADFAEYDAEQGRPISQEQALAYAKLIGRLYTLVHPTSGCGNPHEDWERENEELHRKVMADLCKKILSR